MSDAYNLYNITMNFFENFKRDDGFQFFETFNEAAQQISEYRIINSIRFEDDHAAQAFANYIEQILNIAYSNDDQNPYGEIQVLAISDPNDTANENPSYVFSASHHEWIRDNYKEVMKAYTSIIDECVLANLFKNGSHFIMGSYEEKSFDFMNLQLGLSEFLGGFDLEKEISITVAPSNDNPDERFIAIREDKFNELMRGAGLTAFVESKFWNTQTQLGRASHNNTTPMTANYSRSLN